MLGALSVGASGATVEIRRGRSRVLLCALVVDRGRPVTADTLIDRLWADRLPDDPFNALQTQVAYLRRVLGGAGLAPITTTPSGYLLDGVDVDVDRFETSLTAGRSTDDPTSEQAMLGALAAYDEAVSLWRGSPYHDVAGLDFVAAEIARLEELRLSALEDRCDVLMRLGRTAEAVAELSSSTKAHPLRERGHELLVLALYRAGRQADALRAYDRARRTLLDELGVRPGAALSTLERQVLEHDPALDWVPPPDRDRGSAHHVPPAEPTTAAVAEAGEALHAVAPESMTSGDLIGRDHDVARVRSLMVDRRLVTLTGPGGAGKTRLANEVASAAGARQVHHVDLGVIGEDDRVAHLIAVTLGVQVSAETDLVAALIAAIDARSMLLVLDTCERVVDDVRSVVGGLLTGCPNLSVLATSRRPLGMANELAWPVPPLGVPTEGADPLTAPAFELFVRRATEANPHFELGPGDVDDVAELCRSLDGLPLAIELTAAQMDVLSPRAARDQLASHRTFTSRADGPDRHRTLDATTAWSVDLLDDDERDMLYRLAVFVPTFDLEAAIAVGGLDGDDGAAVARIVSLVRNSLVAHQHDRYRLLDTVRGHLDATEADGSRRTTAQRRHAEHYADLAARSFRQVRAPGQDVWMRRLRADRANIRLALRWCFGPDGDEQLGARIAGDIAWAWTLQGDTLDSQAALEQGEGVDAPPLVRARLLLGIGLLAAPQADHDRVIQVCTESANLGRAAGDDETVAVALLTLGVAQWATGDLQSAAASHDEAIRLFRNTGERWGHTICRVLRARTARDMGDPDLAEELLDAAIDDAKLTADDHVIGLAYEQIARLTLVRGHIERTVVAATASLRHNEAIGYTEGISAALTILAHAECRRGHVVVAREQVTRALTLASNIGHVGAMCAAVEVSAAIAAAEGDAPRAAGSLLVARRARNRHGLPLPALAAAESERELGRLRSEIASGWDDIESGSRLTSLTELVARLLDCPDQSGDRSSA